MTTCSIKKGNISLLVIFILSVSALIGMMAYQISRTVIDISADERRLLSSYYLAKGGLERGLFATQRMDIGYQETFGSGVLTPSMSCYPSCQLDVQIQSRTVSDQRYRPDTSTGDRCTINNTLILTPGQSRIIPLFVDQSSTFSPKTSSASLLADPRLRIELTILQGSYVGLGFSLGSGAEEKRGRHILYRIYSGSEITSQPTNIIQDFLDDPTPDNPQAQLGGAPDLIIPKRSEFASYNNFLIINYPALSSGSIISGDALRYCLRVVHSTQGVPSPTIRISSTATRGQKHVGLLARIPLILPDFLFTTVIER